MRIRLEVRVRQPLPHDERDRVLVKKMGSGIYRGINFAGRIGSGQHTVTLRVIKVIAEIHVSPLSRVPSDMGLLATPYFEHVFIEQNNHSQEFCNGGIVG